MKKVLLFIVLSIIILQIAPVNVSALSAINECTLTIDKTDEESKFLFATVNISLYIPSGSHQVYFALPFSENANSKIQSNSSGINTYLYGFNKSSNGYFLLWARQEKSPYRVNVSLENIQIKLEMSSDFNDIMNEYHLYFADALKQAFVGSDDDHILKIDVFYIQDSNLKKIINLDTGEYLVNQNEGHNEKLKIDFSQGATFNISCITQKPVQNYDFLILLLIVLVGIGIGIFADIKFLKNLDKKWQIIGLLIMGIIGFAISGFLFYHNNGFYKHDIDAIGIITGVIGTSAFIVGRSIYKLSKKLYH